MGGFGGVSVERGGSLACCDGYGPTQQTRHTERTRAPHKPIPTPNNTTKQQQALIAFHKTYYSADIMKLAVVGREPLDKLQVRWLV